MTLTALRTEEPIPGYRVIQRLGAGGYGEVWKADAPGGLQKAIKFVYGYLNDEKAARELKALNRIKQLRHPFLLSLERIEVVEGQLLIVTELADLSLKDRFLVCQKAATGIQRDELLSYMRDAADALDHLCDNALQHLDVKPENLLIVGGRVKVADFGLVKEIQDRTYSMMGGMTPVYAAPEIFDGRPTSHSDQYSLAIVYQEMLTGTLPFPGNTAAQLASQHLNSKPRLDSLPPEDAQVIARALAKNPLDRFTNCREMVAALHGGGRKSSVFGAGSVGESVNSPNRDTTSVGDQQSAVSTFAPGPSSAPAERRTPRRSPAVEPSSQPRHVECRTQAITRPEPKPIIDLPPVEIGKEEIGLRPTLFVGIGGTGGSVLRRLRRRLNDRFGDLSKVPVFQMLLVETDSHALRGQSGAEQGSDLSADEIVMMPLRKPQEYRSETPDILEWLSRRWLYNIPRSLKTEGIRPLGRLALVDHANALFDRARASITQITTPAALAAAQTNTGLALRNKTPRIFVVASTSGGTGSGMALDVAYALRMLLLDMGLSDDGVCGILTHSTPRKSTGKDLATANTYALLNELFHYSRNHFPGEPACGLRAFGFGDPTFPQAYFVHFGDHLDDHDFNHAADALAGYLYLDAATAAGTFFDKCRAATRNALDPNELRLRTLGLCQLGRSQADFIAPAVESICKQVAEQWASGSRSAHPAAPKAADDSAEQTFQAKLTELEMTGAKLAQHFHSLADQFIPPTKLTELTSEILHEQEAGDAAASRAALWSQLTQRARQSLGIVPSHDLPPSAVSLASFATDQVKRRTEQVASQIIYLVHTAADDPNLGLTGAFKSGEKWIEHLRRAEGELAAMIAAAQQRAAQLGVIIDSPPAAARGKQRAEQPITLPQALNEYCGLLVHQKAFETAVRLIQSITGRLAAVNDKLIQLRRDVIHVSNRFDYSDPSANGDDQDHHHQNAVEAALKRQLQTRMTQILKQVAQQAREQCISPAGGLVQLMSGAAQQVDHLPGVLRSLARRAIAASLQEVDIGAHILATPTDESEDSPIDNVLDSARPRMIDCGGGKRLLLIVPDGPSAAKVPEVIEQKHHEKPTVITGGDGDLVACYECEDIPLSSVIARLITDNPSYAEVGHRLHTRIDVDWTAI